MGTPEGRHGSLRVAVIIPALNEELAIADVVRGMRQALPSRSVDIIVVDNGSTDRTAACALEAGAWVVEMPEPGYGRACLTGVAAAGACDLLLFMDGDGADDPAHAPDLLRVLETGEADLVIGSRALGPCEPGSLTVPQRVGNRLACTLMRWVWGGPFTDLGPFRAVTRTAYERLDMTAPTYGWTVEMQVRALKHGLRVAEVPVGYRKRRGRSKISGTVKGVILAGSFILGTIAREALFARKEKPSVSGKRRRGYRPP